MEEPLIARAIAKLVRILPSFPVHPSLQFILFTVVSLFIYEQSLLLWLLSPDSVMKLLLLLALTTVVQK